MSAGRVGCLCKCVLARLFETSRFRPMVVFAEEKIGLIREESGGVGQN